MSQLVWLIPLALALAVILGLLVYDLLARSQERAWLKQQNQADRLRPLGNVDRIDPDRENR